MIISFKVIITTLHLIAKSWDKLPPAEYFRTNLQNGSRLLDKDSYYQIQRKEEIPECVEGSGQEPRRRLSQRGEEQKAG